MDEVMRELKGISEEIQELIQVSKQHIKQLASLQVKGALTFKISDEDVVKNSPKAKPTPGDMKIVGMEKLRKNYSVVQELTEKYRLLGSMETDLQVRFKDQNTAKAEAEIRKLRAEVQKALADCYSILQDIATKHVPKEFLKFLGMVSNVCSKGLQYENVRSHLYVYEKEGYIVFSAYINMIQVTDDNGKLWPSMMVVLSMRVEKNFAGYYVTVLHEFEPPGSFALGKVVSDMKSAVKVIGLLLNMDRFATDLDKLPLSALIQPDSITKELFSVEHSIDAIHASEEALTFTMKPAIKDREAANKVATQLYVELETFIRKTRTRMQMRVFEENKRWNVAFVFVRAGGESSTSPQDLEFLQRRFNLSNEALDKVVQVINRDTI
jgi:hypothetical protein